MHDHTVVDSQFGAARAPHAATFFIKERMLPNLISKKVVHLLLLVLAILAMEWAPVAAQTPQTVTFDQLLSFVQLEVKDEKLLKMLAESPTSFTLGEDQIGKLRAAGASETLLSAIRRPTTIGQSQTSDIRDFVIVLDASASMRDEVEPGVTKWDSAKKAASDLIRSVSNGRRLAFIVYGNDISKRCNSIELLQPLTAITDQTKQSLIDRINAILPSADTPIGASLELAKSLVANTGVLTKVILITDGMESCKGDPVGQASQLATLTHLQGGVDVIGFGLKPQEIEQVEKIAQAGRGKFYNADNLASLRASVAAVEIAMSKPKSREKGTDGLTAAERLLIKNLSDPDSATRASAAVAIKSRNLVAAVPALTDLVSNDVWNVAVTFNGNFFYGVDPSKDLALEALLAMDATAASKGLANAANSSTIPSVGIWAANRMGKFSGQLDARIITKALSDLIVKNSWQVSIPFNGSTLYDRDGRKEEAYKTMKALAPELIEDALVEAAASDNDDIRAWASGKLGELDTPPK